MSVIVGGTIAIDNVKTPTAEATQLLGGSASYASLAASFYSSDVRLVGIIGHDYPQEHLDLLKKHDISLTGIERSSKESFTWTGEYMENMNDRETHAVALNVLEDWTVKVPDEIADSEIIVLANMSPDNQLQMLAGCHAPKRFVIADTMDLWIDIANERLHEVLQNIDLLVLNDSEAKTLAGTSNIIAAGEILRLKGPQYVIIKLGEFGATLFGPDGQLFRCPAWPLKEVNDPTGAGDSFLGAMAGYLDRQSEIHFSALRQGMIEGTIAASFTCEAFSTQKLQEANLEQLQERKEQLREMTQWP